MKLYYKVKAAAIKRISFTLTIICVWLLGQGQIQLFAQNQSPLNRKITITFSQETPQKVLELISATADFKISYNPELLKGITELNGSFENILVKDVLDITFKGKFDYKEHENYVIITLKPKPDPSKSNPMGVLIISGQVLNAYTLAPLSEVSIYDRATLSAAISDKEGNFKLRIDKPSDENEIVIIKRNFKDTVLYLPNVENRNLRIHLRVEQPKSTTPAISPIEEIEDTSLVASSNPSEVIVEEGNNLPEEEQNFEIPFIPSAKTEQGINQQNITNDIYRPFQFSVLPYMGTNGTLSGNVINDYSLNLFGGVSKGTNKLEASAFFNIDLEDVRVAQFAGWFNIVGRDVYGVQYAGLFNVVGRNVTGVQMAGLFNVNEAEFNGIQAAGLINVNGGRVNGAQLAGLINIGLDTVSGWQGAGLMNINDKRVRALQTAGLMNVNGDGVEAAQFAGLMNVNGGNSGGAQFAGLMNLNDGYVKGAQVSGLVNAAGKVKGSQIGFINLADSVGGIQLGFFSFSKRGYHKIEIFADEIFYTNLAFRTGGNHAFYNIFTAGLNPTFESADDLYWTVGYGIGTSPKLSKRLYLNFDITANQLSKGNFLTAQNNLVKLYTGFEVKLAKRLSFNAGATLNTLIRDSAYTDYPKIFTDYQPKIIYEDVLNADDEYKLRHPSIQMWIGFKAGIRFL